LSGRCNGVLTTELPPGTRTACAHEPACPAADDTAHDAARVVASHPEQGWSLLCNGIVVFDDTGEILPDGRLIAPQRAASRRS
jgi:Family of unknown function (DUF5999)